ncbi:MAG: hypothetical protein MK106_00780 [Mariniblastus sp.]|nr:hypothetical protein [Mariniblastus sp.]
MNLAQGNQFEIGTVIRYGWEDFKSNTGILIAAFVIMTVVMVVIVGGFEALGYAILALLQKNAQLDITGQVLLSIIRGVAQLIVQVFLQLGLIALTLKLIRRQRPEISDLFSQISKFWSGLLASLTVTVLVMIGFCLLIIPGIIFALASFLVMWFIVDQDMTAMQAIKASFAATRGSRWNLFLFGWVGFLMAIAALLTCCIGYIVLIPLLSVASGYIYVALSGTPSGPLQSEGKPGSEDASKGVK